MRLAACCLAVAPLPIQSAATGAIHGIVLDARGGTPVARVAVRLQTTGQIVVTDDQGRFEISDVPPGNQELSVSAVDFIVVKQSVAVHTGAVADVTIVLSEGTGRYAETVNVVGAAAPRNDPATPAEQTLRGNALQQLTGVLASDPMRAIQAMPGVVADDDLRSDFSIRGAGVARTNFTFEGIATDFLLHTTQELRDSASIAMINGDALDEVAVANGSYPQRYGNRIGAEVDFRMRDGSRDGIKSQTTVSLINTSQVAEGPLGSARHGSWLVAGRASYLDFVAQRIYPNQGDALGFDDAQAKLTYDVGVHQRLQVALTAGQSQFELAPGDLAIVRDVEGNVEARDSNNRSAIAVMSWRYQPSPRFSLVERVAVDVNAFKSTGVDSSLYNSDAHDVVTRTEWSYAPHVGLTFEGGGEMRRSVVSGYQTIVANNGLPFPPADFTASTLGLSGFAQTRLSASTGAAIVMGIRTDHWSLTSDTTASPWIEGSVPISRMLTLWAGGGIYRQEPTLVELQGFVGNSALSPERAYHADIGIEGHLSPTLRWQTTAYNREDRDLIDQPDLGVRVVDGFLARASRSGRFENALDGYARGVELMLERRSPNGLSGWVSYALGFNRYRDRLTGEAFWGDFDQRHTVNVYGSYRTSDRLSFSARFRAGSNIPTTGYWTERDGLDFVGDARNTLRVPFYSRLDTRMNRTFQWNQKRLTLFVEALNLYNRANLRAEVPIIDTRTFLAAQLYGAQLPFVPSIGVRLEF